MEKNKNIKEKLIPLSLTLAVVFLDQLSKYLIVKNIPPYPFSSGFSFFGDFLRIIHVANTGVAFSVGSTLPDFMRRILFSLFPLAAIIIVLVFYFKSDSASFRKSFKTEEVAFTKIQNWALCGIIGGGIGNLLDRFFRSEGVVDFIDVKFFGIFGMERWPTFNIADSAVVVCSIILLISFLLPAKRGNA